MDTESSSSKYLFNFTKAFIICGITYLMLSHHISEVTAAPNNRVGSSRPLVPSVRIGGQYLNRIKGEPIGDFFVDDNDLFELSKRQTSDDYGHLRFGKRGEEASFDDYGHMRFGRAGIEN